MGKIRRKNSFRLVKSLRVDQLSQKDGGFGGYAQNHAARGMDLVQSDVPNRFCGLVLLVHRRGTAGPWRDGRGESPPRSATKNQRR